MADYSEYKKTTFEDILEYVETKAPSYRDLLEKQVADGERFMVIKKQFFEKYLPEYLPKPKPKKKTMKELMGLESTAKKGKS